MVWTEDFSARAPVLRGYKLHRGARNYNQLGPCHLLRNEPEPRRCRTICGEDYGGIATSCVGRVYAMGRSNNLCCSTLACNPLPGSPSEDDGHRCFVVGWGSQNS